MTGDKLIEARLLLRTGGEAEAGRLYEEIIAALRAETPATSDPQLVADSGLNYWAAKLLAESAQSPVAQGVFDRLGGKLAIDFGHIRITAEERE